MVIDWAATIELGATVATAIATGVLARFTVVLARQTQRLADVTRQASVVVTIEPNPWALNHVDLHVENQGTAAAFDVEVSIDPPIDFVDPQRTLPFRRVSILKADQKLSSYLTEAGLVMNKAFEVTVSWRARPRSNQRQSAAYTIDLKNDFQGVSRLGNIPSYQTAEELKSIRETLQKVFGGLSRFSADIYTSGDRLHDRRQRLRELRQLKREAAQRTSQTEHITPHDPPSDV